MLHERKQGAKPKHTVPLVSAGKARVTASPKGTHAQVSRHGSPLSRTVFWVQVKGNFGPVKFQKPWQAQW